MPLIPSGLSPECPDVLGAKLRIHCEPGWGWEQQGEIVEDPVLLFAHIEVLPGAYLQFKGPRCGITGRVLNAPEGYSFTRFVAFIMSDGVDYDFTRNIAGAWRVIFGTGELDLESDWFPILAGEDALFGYGRVGRDEEWLQRSGHVFRYDNGQIVMSRPDSDGIVITTILPSISGRES